MHAVCGKLVKFCEEVGAITSVKFGEEFGGEGGNNDGPGRV